MRQEFLKIVCGALRPRVPRPPPGRPAALVVVVSIGIVIGFIVVIAFVVVISFVVVVVVVAVVGRPAGAGGASTGPPLDRQSAGEP